MTYVFDAPELDAGVSFLVIEGGPLSLEFPPSFNRSEFLSDFVVVGMRHVTSMVCWDLSWKERVLWNFRRAEIT